MNPIPNPDSWMDVATILLVALIAAVPSWLALRSHKAVQEQAGAVADIKAQVVNGHEGKPALRADLDMLRSDIASLRDEVRGGFAAMRGDIGEERSARRAGSRRGGWGWCDVRSGEPGRGDRLGQGDAGHVRGTTKELMP